MFLCLASCPRPFEYYVHVPYSYIYIHFPQEICPELHKLILFPVPDEHEEDEDDKRPTDGNAIWMDEREPSICKVFTPAGRSGRTSKLVVERTFRPVTDNEKRRKEKPAIALLSQCAMWTIL